MKAIKRNIKDFFSLFFPEVCAACGESLVGTEVEICLACIVNLPHTNFHLIQDNAVARQLWGRVPFVSCGAYLFFSKGSKVQNMMHQLKYNARPKVGFRLGEMYGQQLLTAPHFSLPDVIVPVPLHPDKKKKRGYNQSDYFADGLSESLNIPSEKEILIRTLDTESQTKKSRFLRYENMREMFVVADKERFRGKHVLLVDDIITTGATIEACSEALLQVEGIKLSISGIAFTH